MKSQVAAVTQAQENVSAYSRRRVGSTPRAKTTTTAHNLDYDSAPMLRETAKRLTQQKKGRQSNGLNEERVWGKKKRASRT